VYCQQCWWSDQWDPLSYGRDVDFSRPFLEQFKELLDRTPQFGPQTMHMTMVNSEYCNLASYLKNCYLLFGSDFDEDCAYSTYLENSKNAMDIYMGDLCELCYDSSNIYKCHRVLFSTNCNDCVDVSFSHNLAACSNCFGCINLRSKNYYIFNQPYSKEGYISELKKFDVGSYKGVLAVKERVEELAKSQPRKFAEGLKNLNVSGDYIFNSKNVFLSYEMGGCEDCKFCQLVFIPPAKDSYDVTMWGGNFTRCYECMGAGNGENTIKFSIDSWAEAHDLEYCRDILASAANLFGCYALRNKKYCILNKQYTQEEYESLVPRIIEHMKNMPYVDATGKVYGYGEFLPPELSYFAYNESFAQEYFPLTKEQAIAQGYRWADREERNYQITKNAVDLPDSIEDVPDSILNETIGCAHAGTCNEQCSTAFKLIPSELQFYRSLVLPIPRLCPNCRHYARMGQRNNVTTRFFERRCMCDKKHLQHDGQCPNTFETSYAPERPEIVYCEQCYQAEVV
jgi:hypothetical protein